MDTLLSRVTTMAQDYFGPGQLEADAQSQVFWRSKDGAETPLGWSLEEAEFKLSALLDARTRRRMDEDD